MKRTTLISIVIFTLAVISLAACSALQPAQAPTATQPAAQANGAPGRGGNGNFSLSTEEKLAVGSLKLEGSNQAITADQARKLLPLWQQIQTLSADNATPAEQLQTVYSNIEGIMTADQMKVIDALTFADVQNEMQTLGIQFPQGGGNGNGGNGGNGLTQDQRATRAAEMQTQAAGTPNPNGAPGGGPRFQGTPDPNRTPPAGFNGRRGGTGNVFIEPLIQLLQKRAG